MAHQHTSSPQDRTGLMLGFGAYFIWGLFPLYFHLLHRVPPFEIVAHRILWSMLLLLAVMASMGRWHHLVGIFRENGQILRLTLSASLIAVNWLVYIWAVNNGHILAASLGYFLGPLVSVALGLMFLGERLRTVQWLAVGIAALGVGAAAVGVLSEIWIGMTLAASFSGYGLIRKTTHVPALEGLMVETLVLTPPCLAAMAWAAGHGHPLHVGDPLDDALLILSGAVTSLPLVMFGAAARRLSLATVGLLQYIAPSLVFVIGAFVYHEPLRAPLLAAFALIWLALILYVGETLHRAKQTVPDSEVADRECAEQEIR